MTELKFLAKFSFFNIWAKRAQIGQKQGFYYFSKEVGIRFFCKCLRMKDDIVKKFLVKTPY